MAAADVPLGALLEPAARAAWGLADSVGSCTGCVTATLSAAAFVCFVPLTHGLGGRALFGPVSWSPRATLFKGGASFITFQILSWSFWGAALLAALAAGANLLAAVAPPASALPSSVLAGAAVCGSVLAEVLMVSSLLTFQARAQPRREYRMRACATTPRLARARPANDAARGAAPARAWRARVARAPALRGCARFAVRQAVTRLGTNATEKRFC